MEMPRKLANFERSELSITYLRRQRTLERVEKRLSRLKTRQIRILRLHDELVAHRLLDIVQRSSRRGVKLSRYISRLLDIVPLCDNHAERLFRFERSVEVMRENGDDEGPYKYRQYELRRKRCCASLDHQANLLERERAIIVAMKILATVNACSVPVDERPDVIFERDEFACITCSNMFLDECGYSGHGTLIARDGTVIYDSSTCI
jgi:hypothetical protein